MKAIVSVREMVCTAPHQYTVGAIVAQVGVFGMYGYRAAMNQAKQDLALPPSQYGYAWAVEYTACPI
jgi:hypothetical protein